MSASQVPEIFARSRVVARLARSRSILAADPAAAPLFGPIADDIAERIAFLRHEPKAVLLDGIGASKLTFPMPGSPGPTDTISAHRCPGARATSTP